MTRSRRSSAEAAPASGDRAPNGSPLDEQAVARLAEAHPEGLSAAQIVDEFLRRGVRLSEATFRKWVQLGLLPRSRRVGRKGKHQGSRGLYPTSVVGRIAEIKRLMGDSLTTDEIRRALRFKEEIEGIERGLRGLFAGLGAELASDEAAVEPAAARKESGRLLADLEGRAADLVGRIKELERRVVAPLVRAARARAFAAGAGGGAGDLL